MFFYFSYYYKLSFDVNAYTYDMYTNTKSTYLLTYLLTKQSFFLSSISDPYVKDNINVAIV